MISRKEQSKIVDSILKDAANNGTFKCPDCGGKVLENTKYCLKCKKKVEAA